MNPQFPCLPIDNGFPAMTTNPGCKDGWGWLKNGECGCAPGSPGWKPELNGCSVRCLRVGPLDCPNCPKPMNWAMISAAIVGVGLVAALLRRR